jgi:hypothetical protein
VRSRAVNFRCFIDRCCAGQCSGLLATGPRGQTCESPRRYGNRPARRFFWSRPFGLTSNGLCLTSGRKLVILPVVHGLVLSYC